MIKLIAVDSGNIGYYKTFDEQYDYCLKSYQSRIYPRHPERFEQLVRDRQLFWNYILYQNDFIGSVWLEKDTIDCPTATLGIFICPRGCRGRGIGEEAVRQIIGSGARLLDINKIELRVREGNIRAFRCYQKCGFQATGQFIKNSIPVIQMEKEL